MPVTFRTTVPTVLVALSIAMLTACSRGKPQTARGAPPGASEVSGRLAGFEIRPRDAGFVVSRRDDGGEIVMIVLSDQPEVCRGIQEGWIKLEIFEHPQRRPNSRMLTWTIIGRRSDGQPGPLHPGPVAFGVPPFEGPSRLPPPPGGPFGFPSLVTTDAGGKAHYAPLVDGLSAQLQLRWIQRGPGGIAEGQFTIQRGPERLAGWFRARPCPLSGRWH